MKNNKFAVISLIITAALIACASGVPFESAYAEQRDPYSYLVTTKLGSEWDAWNSMNDALDKDNNKIKTEEYVDIVQDPTKSNHGGVLRIGNEDYKTSISLRLTESTTVNYSHKFEGNFYIDGKLNTDSYILFKNANTWDNGSQNRLDIIDMTPEKWVTVNTENAADLKDGLYGYCHTHISDGYATLIFSIELDAGNYLYIDDLKIASGVPKTYEKNIDTNNGDEIIYSNDFAVTLPDIEKQSVSYVDEWTNWVSDSSKSEFYQSVGTVTENENTSLVFYNEKKAFTGSIIQNVLGIENGTYTLSVDYRSNGCSSAVISASGYGGSKIQTDIKKATDDFKTVTINGISVTDNKIDVTVYFDGKAAEYVVVDNVTLKKDGAGENLILNGDFESSYSKTQCPERKGSLPKGWGSWLDGADSKTQFIANEGYKSDSSMAAVYDKDSGSNFNQTVSGLKSGGNYVVSAYVKFKGDGDARLYLKNYGSSTNIKLPQSDTWVKIFGEVTLSQTADRISLEFYCNAKALDWFMVDNVKLFEKQNPSVNLIENGGFEDYTADSSVPAIEVDYKEHIPNFDTWVYELGGSDFAESVGTVTEDGNTRLAVYNKDKDFTGSIIQKIPELENGNYTVSVMARTHGYNSAVISVTDYDKDNKSAKIQKTIADVNEELTRVSIDVPVTNNSMTVTVYADGLAGQYIIVDDVTVTAEGSDKQLVLNGDFETKEPSDASPPQRLADIAYDWSTWSNDGNTSDMFVADGGYNSVSSFAMVSGADRSESLTQTVSDLPDGTYVFSAFFKSSGTQKDVALIAKGFDKNNDKTQVGTKLSLKTNVWTRALLEFEVTSHSAVLSVWNDAFAGDSLMVDNMKLYRKSEPEAQLLKNGEFDDYYSYPTVFKLPPRAVRNVNQTETGGKASGNYAEKTSDGSAPYSEASNGTQAVSPFTVDAFPFVIACAAPICLIILAVCLVLIKRKEL